MEPSIAPPDEQLNEETLAQIRMLESSHVERDRIDERIESRRLVMQRQIIADQIQSKLCDNIKNTIDKKIAADLAIINETMPEVAKFIKSLQFVQSGIWCNTCKNIKNVTLPSGKMLYTQPAATPEEPRAEPAPVPAPFAQSLPSSDELITTKTPAPAEPTLSQVRELLTQMNTRYTQDVKQIYSIIAKLTPS